MKPNPRGRGRGSSVVSALLFLVFARVGLAADSSEYAPYDRPGMGLIEGSASVSPKPGVRTTLASRVVMLRPATAWTKRWWEEWALEGRRTREADPAAQAHTREAVADADGRVRFTGLPAGTYDLLGSMIWADAEDERIEGRLYRVVVGRCVTLKDGEHATVALDSLRSDLVWGRPWIWEYPWR